MMHMYSICQQQVRPRIGMLDYLLLAVERPAALVDTATTHTAAALIWTIITTALGEVAPPRRRVHITPEVEK